MLFGHVCILTGEVSIQIFAHFKELFIHSGYMLLDILFLNIFFFVCMNDTGGIKTRQLLFLQNNRCPWLLQENLQISTCFLPCCPPPAQIPTPTCLRQTVRKDSKKVAQKSSKPLFFLCCLQITSLFWVSASVSVNRDNNTFPHKQ